MNSNLLADASTETRALIVGLCARWVHANVGRNRPEHLVDGAESCVGLGEAVPGCAN
jgi:hypothetical protein